MHGDNFDVVSEIVPPIPPGMFPNLVPWPSAADTGLKFSIGPTLYVVRISDEPLIFEGRQVDGLCDEGCEESGVITLCSLLPRRRRLHILIHELRHAWVWLHGRSADDDEADANNVASFTLDVMRQLQEQGGEPALLRMEAA